MSRVRIGVGVGALVLAGPVAWFLWNVAALTSFPAMPSAYEAKEYCSCRWVSGRDDGFCDRFVHQDVVPTQGRVVDEAARTVTASALWVSSTARWVDRPTGCVLVD